MPRGYTVMTSRLYQLGVVVESASPNISVPHLSGRCVPCSLQKAGDVVSAAGRPGEGIGICSNMSCHKFCCLMTFRPTRISNSIMVHTKTVLMRKKEKRHK